MTLAWTANITSLLVPTLILTLYHLERGQDQVYLYIPHIPSHNTSLVTMVTDTSTSGTCLISSWVHQHSITNHVMVKVLIFTVHTFSTLTVYTAIVVKLKVRGICEEHDKCTKVSIRTISMGVLTISSWLPTIVVRNILRSQDASLIKVTQNIFYLNAIFDPIVYIFTEKILDFLPCLNSWKRDRSRPLPSREDLPTSMRTFRPQSALLKRNNSLLVTTEISIG